MSYKPTGDAQVLATRVSAKNPEDFKIQFRAMIGECKFSKGLVYLLNAESDIPRLKGTSPVVYIGKALGSLSGRYGWSQIAHEQREYWERYKYIISAYGPLYMQVYESANPERDENCLLYKYHNEHFELPPLNLQSYKRGLL